MKLSIGIPCYNQGAFLDSTIQSLLKQTVAPFEIVASDNHSEDDTASILERYKSQGVRVVRPPVHLGMVAHWQFLASQLDGDWLTLISSDDLALPTFVQTILETASIKNDAVLVRAPFYEIDEAGNVLGLQRLRSVKRVSEPYRNVFEQLAFPKGGFAAFALKRSAFTKAGGFPDLELIGDWGMWIRIAPYGSFVKASKPISCYRSNYRQDVMKSRIFGFIRDEEKLHKEIIPIASDAVGIGPFTRAIFSKQRMLLSLDRASEVFPYPDAKAERNRVAEALKARAVECNATTLLENFASGQSIKMSRYSAFIRQIVFNLVGRFNL